MMMMKTALVTGASRGIGRAIAVRLARDGFYIAVNFRENTAAAEETLRIIGDMGGKGALYRADISDGKAVSEMLEKISVDTGGAEVIVNNAGIAEQIMFCDITEEKWDRMFNVDVKGAYLVTQAALPYMIHQKYGRVINISSMWGVSGGSCEVHYSAAKAALIGMTKALAKELGPSGITVNCIAPGVITTEMNSHLDGETLDLLRDETPVMRLGTPEDVAEAVSYFASRKAGFVTGQVLSVDGGITL
ncbi:MAG: elongation factor P 5-aminopentanone reductase [Oscillospiraceae bacterium]